jgi:hypothetical protein
VKIAQRSLARYKLEGRLSRRPFLSGCCKVAVENCAFFKATFSLDDNFIYISMRNNMDAGLYIVTLMPAGLYFLAWLDGLSKKIKRK